MTIDTALEPTASDAPPPAAVELPSLVAGLQATAARTADARGIRYYTSPTESVYVGYAELDRRARSIAAGFQAAGRHPGDAVVIAVLPGLSWVEVAYGALYAGLVVVPVALTGFGTDDSTIDRIAGIAAASRAVAVVGEDATAAILDARSDDLPGVLLVETLAGTPAADWQDPGLTHESVAALLFTSGSTGDPKGVIVTHGVLLGMVDSSVELFDLSSESVAVAWVPMHHAMGLAIEIVLPSILGCQAVLTSPEQFQRRPITWLQLLSEHRGTFTAAGNFAFAVCTKLATDEQIAELDLSSVEILACGSEPIDPATAAAFLERFRSTGITETAFTPVLGMSEMMIVSSKLPGDTFRSIHVDADALERGEFAHVDEGEGAVRFISLGVPSATTTLRIADPETGERLPDGEVGELWVSSEYMSPGYFARPDANAAAFGARLAGDDLEYYRSGDLGVIEDGELYLTGRIKEVIIIRGRKLYPHDLEAYARAAHPAVTIGAAFELKDAPSAVGVVVELDAESDADPESVAAAVRTVVVKRASLPSLAVAVVDAGSIPRTPTGKVRRRPTLEALERGALAARFSRGFAEAAPVRND
ncbi:hypothetical protein ET445_16475 [Agromyces protaetiae]|uniref:AMP-dependent synthetase/ligase domain-containing protein n=1 Tax=Agromyces protaetiae TaxID=2509455 RepID=A0A4P6FEY0_9MICO|nr:AMP-binding protein [Agromyces protaetiae]QAY74692.1 hypothetical protein ET445_16475 [Agromyces protaetiae]